MMRSVVVTIFLSLLAGFAKADNEQLPVKLIPAKASPAPLVFLISGDGGWNNFIQSVSECLARKGMPVAGLDSKSYFWKGRSPGQAAADIHKAIISSLKATGRKSYILVGYSFGACIVPFIASRTPENLRQQMAGVYSISPDERGDFEIHISDMLSLGTVKGSYDVVAEMKKIKEKQPVCIFGSAEKSSVVKRFSDAGIKTVTLSGNHHYNNNYCALAETVARNEGIK